MSDELVIDNVEFAARAGELAGVLPVEGFERLADLLRERTGEVRYRVSGRAGAQGQPELLCELSASLRLTCQRCLGALTLPVETSSRFVIGDLPSDADELDDGPEALDPDKQMDIRALIEDELILALPLSARHEPSACSASDRLARPATPNTGAFAALAAIKGRVND